MKKQLIPITLLSGLLFTACGETQSAAVPQSGSVQMETTSFAKANQIITAHCLRCHSRKMGRVEEGISLDSYDEIKKERYSIRAETVLSKSMPPRKESTMTQAERDYLGQWLDAGLPQ